MLWILCPNFTGGGIALWIIRHMWMCLWVDVFYGPGPTNMALKACTTPSWTPSFGTPRVGPELGGGFSWPRTSPFLNEECRDFGGKVMAHFAPLFFCRTGDPDPGGNFLGMWICFGPIGSLNFGVSFGIGPQCEQVLRVGLGFGFRETWDPRHLIHQDQFDLFLELRRSIVVIWSKY